MSTFNTLIFIPEGSLLNEKLAVKTALRQTLNTSVLIGDQLRD